MTVALCLLLMAVTVISLCQTLLIRCHRRQLEELRRERTADLKNLWKAYNRLRQELTDSSGELEMLPDPVSPTYQIRRPAI